MALNNAASSVVFQEAMDKWSTQIWLCWIIVAISASDSYSIDVSRHINNARHFGLRYCTQHSIHRLNLSSFTVGQVRFTLYNLWSFNKRC